MHRVIVADNGVRSTVCELRSGPIVKRGNDAGSIGVVFDFSADGHVAISYPKVLP
jgi:hypothetical protein